ncbi:MAG: NAD(P)-dependent oxidoreductase, partial [Pseudomonadota bacterium]
EARGHTIACVPRNLLALQASREVSDYLQDHQVTDVVHLAAQSNPAGGNHELFYTDNAFLTDRLLGVCAAVKLPGRFLYVSATSVYGQSDQPFDETSRLNPLNHYAASKMLAEAFVGWRQDELDVAIVRPSNCIGRGQKQQYLVPKLVSAFRSRDPEIAMGDTRISRDFVDVRDATDILGRLLEASPGLPHIANASSGKATSIAQVIELLSDITGHRPAILYDERFVRPGDILFQACRNHAAIRLGHRPRYSLRETLQWMLGKE